MIIHYSRYLLAIATLCGAGACTPDADSEVFSQSAAFIQTPWAQVPPTAGAQENDGPYRSGQVSDIDVSPAGAPTALAMAWGGYFVGGPGGFTAATDSIPFGRTRSIARNPANANAAVIATGSSPSNGLDSWGIGLFTTTNNGGTWTQTLPAGFFSGAWRIEKVRWGTGSNVFAASNRGVERSLDQGITWAPAFGYQGTGYDPATDAFDIAIDPSLTAPQDTRAYIVTGNGRIMRTQDNGNSWLSMAFTDPSGQPLRTFSGALFDPTQMRRGTRLAVSKLLPSHVFLMAEGPSGFIGFFRSTNFANGFWTPLNPGTCIIDPSSFRSSIAVSPTNSQVVIAAGGDDNGGQACLSTNEGSTWSIISVQANPQLHLDYRAVAFSTTGIAYLGGDGGIFSSTDNGTTWTSAGNLGLPSPTVGSFDVSATNSNYLYMATWDTGLWASVGNSYWRSQQQDTIDVESDPTNNLRAWGAVGLIGESRMITVDGGVHFDAFNGNLGAASNNGMMRTNGGTTLFTGQGNAVFSTTIPSTPRPPGGVAAPFWSRWPFSNTPNFTGPVQGLAVDRPQGGNQLYIYAWIARASDGTAPVNKLYVFNPATFAWTTSGANWPSTTAVTRVGTIPNGTLAYAVLDNNTIWTSSDHGGTWTSVTGNAPSGMIDVAIDPTLTSRVFVSTDHGIFRSTSAGVWSAWGLGLPNQDGAGAVVTQIRSVPVSGTTYLYASVEGRGIYRRPISSDP